jgi:hypothetical protein
MIDPKEIHAAFPSAEDIHQKIAETLSASFLASAPDMSIDSAANASAIASSAEDIGAKSLERMMSLKQSINQQVRAHQQAQRARQPHDFTPDMNDLRQTVAHGFPQEMADEFFARFDKSMDI